MRGEGYTAGEGVCGRRVGESPDVTVVPGRTSVIGDKVCRRRLSYAGIDNNMRTIGCCSTVIGPEKSPTILGISKRGEGDVQGRHDVTVHYGRGKDDSLGT